MPKPTPKPRRSPSTSRALPTPPPPNLRERNRREKLQRLTEAARTLFREQGFHETTIRQIAARAGIGVGTVFLYVKGKEGLLELLFSEAVLGVQEAAFATLVDGGSLVDELLHIFGSFYRYYDRDRSLSRIFVKELLFMPDEQSEQHRALTMSFLFRLAARVERAQGRGELRRDLPPMMATTNFFAAYFLLLVGMLDLSHGHALAVEQVIELLRGSLELQLQGLRPPSPSPAGGPRRSRRSNPKGVRT